MNGGIWRYERDYMVNLEDPCGSEDKDDRYRSNPARESPPLTVIASDPHSLHLFPRRVLRSLRL